MLKAVIRILLPMAVCVSLCLAQGTKVYTIDTVVGGAVYDGLPATSTPLSFPIGVYIDRDGAIWIADTGNQVIRKIDPATGTMRVAAGGGTTVDDSVPVPVLSVRLDRPMFLTGDSAGNIYFSDAGSHRIRKLTPDGQVSTVVGTGQPGFAGDGGPARLAKLNAPTGLVFDAAGNLYFSDAGNSRVRRVDTAGTITTIAGSGQCQTTGDGGPALNAGLPCGSVPHTTAGLAFDSKGNLHVATNDAIRRIDNSTGIISTVLGVPNVLQCGVIPDGASPTSQPVCGVMGILFDQDDTLFFTHSNGLAKISKASGLLTSISAVWQGGGLARDAAGKLVFSSPLHARIFQIEDKAMSQGAFASTIGGTLDAFDGPAKLAVLVLPRGMASDAQGNAYVAERTRGRVRRYTPATGQIATVAGGGSTKLADGVAATAASAGDIQSVHVDSQGNIYFDQLSNVWKVDVKTGTVSRLAGQLNTSGSSGDGGPATQAMLGHTNGLTTDAAGNLYISDGLNHRIRKVDAATGIISPVAGNGTCCASTGDGGPATAAGIPNPGGIALDTSGQLLIASACVRRVNLSTGVITTVQGRTSQFPNGNFCGGSVLAADKNGNIFLGGGSQVYQFRASDNSISTVAGSPSEGFFGDGNLATLARLSMGQGGIAADPSGNIYLADEDNGRVRKLTLTVVKPEMAVSPSTLFFTQVQGSSLITAQQFTISSANGLPFDWTLEISTSAGGSWLNASRTSGTAPATILLTVDASKLGSGSYRATVTVKSAATTVPSQTVDVLLTVTGVAGAALGLSQQYLNFQAVAGGGNPAPQTLSISNVGSGTLSWSATAETSSGGQWLRISSGLGTAPSTLTISADITGLAQGTYQGRVVLRNLVAGDSTMVSVVLNVTRTQPILLPTQTGFLFTGVEGSLVIGPQSFAIQNAGQGKLDWQVTVNMPGGGNWLRVSPLAGTSDASQPLSALTPLTLQVDPGRLKAGVSVALLTISASGALNSPQTAIVLVNTLPRGTPPVATINPLGLIFTALAGTTSGALAQGITIASTGGQALQFLARTQTQAGGGWLSLTPEQGVLLSSAESVNLSVQANPTGLAAGVYFGSIVLSFGTGVTQEVAVALVVSPAAASAAAPGSPARLGTWDLGPGTPAAACTPRRLVVVETKLGNRFSTQTGWPIPMLVQIVDDCGAAVSTATVTASFTGGEPSLVFQNLRNGQYSATWVPAKSGSIGVTIRATSTGLEDGVAQFAGTLGQASALPLVFRDGWVNAASFDRFKPLAPGMIFSVFGNNLAEGKNLASEIPLPRTLGNLKATMGGYEVPLFYADGGQVNGQVPFEVPVGTASLVVTGKGSAGAPGTVTVVGAQPGIFTFSQSGTGQGIVLSADNRLADTKNPVHAGDTVVIYATGLGATNPAVATGQSAPSSPLAVVAPPPKVTIGGLEATVDFAGLAPGFVGLYQVNARIPAGVAAGNAVPLAITQNGIASNTVTIAVQ